MSPSPTGRRRWMIRHLPLSVLALLVVVLLPFAGSSEATPGTKRWTPMSPVEVTFGSSADAAQAKKNGTRDFTVLSYNDFHGALEPPTGSGGVVNGTPAGGAEYLATWLRRLSGEAKNDGRPVITAAAGDNVGASPLISAAFHDEPTIEAENQLGLDVTSVGNHEFDEGTDELQRLQNGGCHPVDGCADGDPFNGADFQYLAANVVDKQTEKPLLPPYMIRKVKGVKVGFIGMTLEGTPKIVNPAGITKVKFLDEAETANRWGRYLMKEKGVNALVLLIHEGGAQTVAPPGVPDPSSCADFAGPVTDIVSNLRPEFGLVVSGHTHRFYSCAMPNLTGQSVVTSAGSNGVLVTDINGSVDKKTGKWAKLSAQNVIVENGVRNPDGTWKKDEQGNFVRNPDTVDPKMKRLVDKYRTAVAPIANKVVGKISADIVKDVNPAGESPLGDVIADAQLGYTKEAAGAQIALMNPGGIRASLIANQSSGGEANGEVTFGEAFTVQPFNNLVVTQTFTGEQLKDVLEQQFAGHDGQAKDTILQVSNGFTFTYSASAPAGSKITEMKLDGQPIVPATSYKVTTNDFLANGGDGFTNLTAGTDRVTAPGFDVDALTALLGAGEPVAPGPANRITKAA
jgi:5'-nucleotidase